MTNKNGESVESQRLQNIEKILNIKINPDSLIQSLVVNKITEKNQASLWYFAICIDRQWEPKLNTQQEEYSEFIWSEIKDLNKIKITPDLVKILETIDIWEKYLEL